jgi:predicted ribosome quality control (RQC) complex YloA/Tae2 family protein
MQTDWLLIRRLARELEERLRGRRVVDAGLLADGRVGILFRLRGGSLVLAIDLFTSPPLVTLEEVELGIGAEPGFTRALARSLRGMALTTVTARRDDRLLRLRFAARSRFGVGDELDLYIELVPRFGNLVLVKGATVVAARKEFSVGENPRRAVAAGMPYVLPPLPTPARTIAAVSPPDEDAPCEPLFVYRRDGKLLQAHVVPLPGFDDAECSREPSLLQLFAEVRAQQSTQAGKKRIAARRGALLRRIDDREGKLRSELASLAQKRVHAEQRDALRTAGEEIFATLHSLDETEREAAKERAADLFARYKKLAKSLPHVAARESSVRGSLEAVETLRWEAERAEDEDLDSVETAVAQLRPRRGAPAPSRFLRRKRALLEFRTPGGSRIVVGRSPIENAELTFRLARPNDLWFHAQRIPGAHVILSRDDRRSVPEDDLELAASLAAFYSRAKAATAVPVDYTLRKHVRKQRAAPPGLVRYTDAKTIVARPREGPDFAARNHPAHSTTREEAVP